MSHANGHSRIILPGQQTPVVAGSIAGAAAPRPVSPVAAVQLLQSQGVPTDLQVGHKPGAVFLALACGPFAVPLTVTPEQAREIRAQLDAAIDAADPPPPGDVLPFLPADAATDAPTDDDEDDGEGVA